jgi:hypothetical protein
VADWRKTDPGYMKKQAARRVDEALAAAASSKDTTSQEFLLAKEQADRRKAEAMEQRASPSRPKATVTETIVEAASSSLPKAAVTEADRRRVQAPTSPTRPAVTYYEDPLKTMREKDQRRAEARAAAVS